MNLEMFIIQSDTPPARSPLVQTNRAYKVKLTTNNSLLLILIKRLTKDIFQILETYSKMPKFFPFKYSFFQTVALPAVHAFKTVR